MGAKQSTITSRSSSPPNKFKFSKLQMLKLNILQSALRPQEAASEPLPELSEAREAFMSLISTLIAASQRFCSTEMTGNDPFLQSLKEVFVLFTVAFVKNMNLAELVEVFEVAFEGRRVAVHLLLAYVQVLQQLQSLPQQSSLCTEVLQSLLVLLSANLHTCTQKTRYFYASLQEEFTEEEKLCVFECLLTHFCSGFGAQRAVQYSLWPGAQTSFPLPLKTRLSSTLLLLLFVDEQEHGFFTLLNDYSDSKAFGMLLLVFSQIFSKYPEALTLPELTVCSLLLNCLVLRAPYFRRFLLSKLDIEDFVIILAKVLYSLMKGSATKQKQISLNLYLICGVLISLSEDGAFIEQLYESNLERTRIRWFEGELGSTSSFGSFLLCLGFDLMGANLASKDGFRDEFLHDCLKALLFNLSQYCKHIDDRLLAARFFSLFNGLLPECKFAPNCKATRCALDALCVLCNATINAPQTNASLLLLLTEDSSRILQFLQSLLTAIDAQHSAQLSAHLSEEDLEFTALIVGVLRFLERVQAHVQGFKPPLSATCLQSFPLPTKRRDSRGEAWLLGIQSRLQQSSFTPATWSQFASLHSWTLVYSLISWQHYVSDR